ncbi:transposase [Rathayibacter tritici]|uniref:transposase n=1 Tax=Rathayibacter tritici TaxID=33888 RepID=UPI000A04E4DA|nr:hypothetical protein C5D18_10030 [Rathayibacter tritici]
MGTEWTIPASVDSGLPGFPSCTRLLSWVQPAGALPRKTSATEDKRDAIALIIDGGYSVAEVSKQLNVSETSIRKWMAKAAPTPLCDAADVGDTPLTEPERAEVKRLRRERAHRERQIDFAKKCRPGSRTASGTLRWHR